MLATEIRKNFLSYFQKKGHIVVPSSSLLPDDPSVLLTTAGMQQFKKYYTAEADPMTTLHPTLGRALGSRNVTSIQKSFRTSDIDEVGDDTHNTFFEMLGNFSFGGYFKKEAIRYAYEFITQELGLSISYVTIFKGSGDIRKDNESGDIWHSLGVTEVREEGMEDVFWGPTGNSGPCGPTTEIYCANASGHKIEIWNIVFNEYFFQGTREELLAGNFSQKLSRLDSPGVDTGMGLERLAMISQGKKNIFATDLFAPYLELLPQEIDMRHKRIIVDHLRGAIFLLADGVRPTNKGPGYILRRLLRRVFVYQYSYKLSRHIFESIVHDLVHEYGQFYKELLQENINIRKEYKNELEKFSKMLERGIHELKKTSGKITAESAFRFYESFGIPFEIIKEFGKDRSSGITRDDFDKEVLHHQEISRAGLERKFGGHGLILDTGELKAANEEEVKKVTRLHTATHLLQKALKNVLGEEVHQAGSDITAERTRFDFTFPRKMTSEEIKKVEEEVNLVIQHDLPVQYKEMKKEDAENSGALFFFKEKYPDKVKVYYAGNSLEEAYSKEFCGGPHVSHTGEIGKFKILKEESSSAGVRRIRATVD